MIGTRVAVAGSRPICRGVKPDVGEPVQKLVEGGLFLASEEVRRPAGTNSGQRLTASEFGKSHTPRIAPGQRLDPECRSTSTFESKGAEIKQRLLPNLLPSNR